MIEKINNDFIFQDKVLSVTRSQQESLTGQSEFLILPKPKLIQYQRPLQLGRFNMLWGLVNPFTLLINAINIGKVFICYKKTYTMGFIFSLHGHTPDLEKQIK